MSIKVYVLNRGGDLRVTSANGQLLFPSGVIRSDAVSLDVAYELLSEQGASQAFSLKELKRYNPNFEYKQKKSKKKETADNPSDA